MQIIWGVCVTGQIYWFQYNSNISQYFAVFFGSILVFIGSSPVPLQIMMSIQFNLLSLFYILVIYQWLSVCLQCQMRKGERENTALYWAKSPLLFPRLKLLSITCHKLKHFFFSIYNIYLLDEISFNKGPTIWYILPILWSFTSWYFSSIWWSFTAW